MVSFSAASTIQDPIPLTRVAQILVLYDSVGTVPVSFIGVDRASTKGDGCLMNSHIGESSTTRTTLRKRRGYG